MLSPNETVGLRLREARPDCALLGGDLELKFKPDRPGLCLFHFHQQMHMDNGSKMLFKIV